jgi:phospholipid/cholesterol/gamma-HCH transport system ATP-binding protein
MNAAAPVPAAAAGPPVAELAGVTLSFGDKQILQGIDLAIPQKERLVILGQSGGGKSTLLRLILGILKPTAGSVKFKGREVSKMSRRRLNRTRQRVGMVYQYSALISSLSVRDNLALPLEELTDKPKSEIDEIVDEKLCLVGMQETREKMPAELSGGMKKRIGLARALVLDPELILFDEPSAGLDPVTSSVVDDLIISLSEKIGATSVIVTHEMDSAFKIATQMAMLYEGKIIAVDTPARFKNHENAVVAQFVSGETEGPHVRRLLQLAMPAGPRSRSRLRPHSLMNILRNEVRTGLLVVLTVVALVATLLYLGKPGVFVKQKTYRVFFDNAAGIKQGAAVLIAGRKVGQVARLFSPVPEGDRPQPKYEALVEITVQADALIYRQVRVQMVQMSLLGDTVIDFTTGQQASGLAPDGAFFLGERQSGLADAVPQVLERIDPVLKTATETLDSLQKTAANLTKITAEGSDLPVAFAEFRTFGNNLVELSGPEGALRRSLGNIETLTGEGGRLDKSLAHVEQLTGPEGDLSKTLRNAQKFTNNLANNKDIDSTLANFRRASENLNTTVSGLGTQFKAVGANLEQASDTVKRQPWRLIWPSTKKYDEAGRAAPPQPRLTVEKPRSRSKRANKR